MKWSENSESSRERYRKNSFDFTAKPTNDAYEALNLTALGRFQFSALSGVLSEMVALYPAELKE
ncbi:MAG: hypothetical protein AAF478_14240 [Pseudomonadota bacterium]